MSDLQVGDETKPRRGRVTSLLCQTNKGSERRLSLGVNVKTERKEEREKMCKREITLIGMSVTICIKLSKLGWRSKLITAVSLIDLSPLCR